MDSSQMPTARGREIASTGCRHHPGASPKLNGIAKEDVRQQTAKPMQSIPRSGMADLQYASCLDNSNHPEADRALPSIWTLFCCQSAQEIVRYPAKPTLAEQVFSPAKAKPQLTMSEKRQNLNSANDV